MTTATKTEKGGVITTNTGAERRRENSPAAESSDGVHEPGDLFLETPPRREGGSYMDGPLADGCSVEEEPCREEMKIPPEGGVLIVDDSEITRTSIRAILENNGFPVAGEAGGGLEAVSKAIEMHPDLVLMDVVMEDLNGIEAARQILDRNSKTRIIMMTSAAKPSTVKDCIRIGAVNFMIKPFSEKSLVNAVRRYLPQK